MNGVNHTPLAQPNWQNVQLCLQKFSMMSTATRSPLYCGMSAFAMLLPYLLRDCTLSSTIRAVRAKGNVCLL